MENDWPLVISGFRYLLKELFFFFKNSSQTHTQAL